MRLKSISFLRAFAALIILNSHCTGLYPTPSLAKGGALGNSLFFLMSGFLLYPIKLEFNEWIKKRYTRLYIPVLFLGMILIILRKMELNLQNLFFGFIFPEKYWFICALIIMYPLYYLIIHKNFDKRKYLWCTLILLMLYTFIYCIFLDTSKYIVESVNFHDGIKFTYVFSFFLMITGGYIHSRMGNIMNSLKSCTQSSFLIYLLTFVSLMFYFAFIFLMSINNSACRYQFMETVLCITTTLGFFFSVVINEDFFSKATSSKWFARFLMIGDYTLEIYLLQALIIDFIIIYFNVFPINVALVYLLTILLASGFSKLVALINNTIASKA